MTDEPRGGTSFSIVNLIGLLGLIAGYLALSVLATGHRIAGLIALAMLAGFVAVFVMPAGHALGVGLGNPSRVDGPTRTGALLASAAGLLLGWLVLQSHTAPAVPVGLLLLGASAMAATVALFPPLPGEWRLPGGSLAAGILLLLAGVMAGELERQGPRDAYFTMRAALHQVVSAQEAVRADSGRYTTHLDTNALDELFRFQLDGGRAAFALRGDGYAVTAATHRVEAACAAFVGPVPEAPATEPGVVACTPYPERGITMLGTLWLLGLAVSAVGSFLLRNRLA